MPTTAPLTSESDRRVAMAANQRPPPTIETAIASDSRVSGNVVAGWHTGGERQHGDEVRGPYTKAHGDCRDRKPGEFHRPFGASRVVEKRHPGKGRQGAHEGCESNEPEVVMFE